MTSTPTPEKLEIIAADSEAIEWLNEQIAYQTGYVAKCAAEVAAFSQHENGEPFARAWQRYHDEAKTRLARFTALAAIASDRDEWRTQHENLLSVRQSDLAALTSNTRKGDPDRLREALEDEREQCALIALSYNLPDDVRDERDSARNATSKLIAKAIRNRTLTFARPS